MWFRDKREKEQQRLCNIQRDDDAVTSQTPQEPTTSNAGDALRKNPSYHQSVHGRIMKCMRDYKSKEETFGIVLNKAFNITSDLTMNYEALAAIQAVTRSVKTEDQDAFQSLLPFDIGKSLFPKGVEGVKISPEPVVSGKDAIFKISVSTCMRRHLWWKSSNQGFILWISCTDIHDLCYETCCLIAPYSFLLSHFQTLAFTPPVRSLKNIHQWADDMEFEAIDASVRNHVLADIKHNSEACPFSMELCCIHGQSISQAMSSKKQEEEEGNARTTFENVATEIINQ
ncbi:hypothetical protein HID58_088126 [Brassica napus]|uniref:Uncharacterized protein n=2 Tax=Brassica napus TaxID=3708 RepID=A0ABQ7XV88_BRANA|nr:hypothetical protein HID58_088126 [Brassica napus]